MKTIRHSRWPVVSLAVPLFLLLGCGASRVGTDHWLSPFRYTVPALQHMRTKAVSRSFPGTFDEVWEAAVLIVTKSGTVADAQKQSGLIVYFTDLTHPSVILVDAVGSGDTKVSFDVGEYAGPAGKKPPAVTADRAKEAERFFTQLAIQLLAEKRWRSSGTRSSGHNPQPAS